jgi:regulation of enolase protein 1 (concanavalin A-like superfamily)
LETNLSAPRLLRTLTGDWSVQITCEPISRDLPATGGLVVWKDEKNFTRLDWGKFGRREITFVGCLEGKDVLIGRGRLAFQERVWLRMERRGRELHAFCSADGQQWFTVGRVSFPAEDPLQVGMYVIGDIDRTVYLGAYAGGAALRFTSFGLFN